MQGVEQFNKDLKQLFEENNVKYWNIHQYISISSVGYSFCEEYGCLDGVYALSGKPQEFIQRCVNGGRCMTANNEKIIVEGKIQDFDAVSLYPSAMYIMDGIPLGIPKIITPDIDLDKVSTYFVEIEITSLNSIPYRFPQIFINSKESKKYVNQCVDSFYIDKRGLMDLEEFYDIEYRIKRGYYFDEGFNTKINTFVKKLFDLRLKYKEQGNPLQNTIKLVMNSIYGKSIMKNISTDTIVVNKDDLDRFAIRYYNYITEIASNESSDKVFIKKTKPVNDHWNVPQFGASVLSWSKHIMNSVIGTAEQNNIPIFYTDTDSIHILDEDIARLSECYKKKYNKQLIGSQLTQFHTDFESINGKPSYSRKFIGLGKKSYIDLLCTDQESSSDIKYHIRMKGIPERVLLTYCKKYEITPMDLYQQLYDVAIIDFDLTQGSNCFKKTNTFNQITLDRFKRTVKY
jgi:hypothetical protein